MRRLFPRPRSPRRGVTLVEMLITLALLVLMMTIIVQIFQAATGAVTAAKTYQELDGSLRQLDSTIRQDLGGVTATMTPAVAGATVKNNGYFEYGENSFADLQGEDTDDYLRFTAQAPEGQPFTGRMWIGFPTQIVGNNTIIPSYQPIQVTSQYAEIIYFLRNGNLYRRVLLVAPERQTTLAPTFGYNVFAPSMFPGNSQVVSWQGMNDLSAHPAPTGQNVSNTTLGYQPNAIILNSLSDLANRENRFASPRFCSDFVTNLGGSTPPDGIPDDQNLATVGGQQNTYGDSVPDFWPTLYPTVFSPKNASNLFTGLVFDFNAAGTYITAPRAPGASYQTMAFPYVFPGMYSKPEYNSAINGLGWIHSVNSVLPATSGGSYLSQLQTLNHSPLDLGDSLPYPQLADMQTWWGFPTWRETLSPLWTDPYQRVSATQLQPFGLNPLPPTTVPPGNPAWLPIVSAQPNSDNIGPALAAWLGTPNGPQPLLAALSWEDDLILTGVRSFDVKALDDTFGGYADLGWGDDLRLYSGYGNTANVTPPYYSGNPSAIVTQGGPPVPLPIVWPPGSGNTHDVLNASFAHEGRMPPLQGDFRYNPNFYNPSNQGGSENIGDDNTTVIRLRRVWDSWSTDYTNSPTTGFDPSTSFPTGPPFGPPVYPSYPPPYPAPLRGIQIQIRVVDPRNARTKVLTIRQDFSDKL